MADHVLGNHHLVVVLAVVDLELEPDEAGQDGRGAGLRAHGGHLVALLLGEHDRKAARRFGKASC